MANETVIVNFESNVLDLVEKIDQVKDRVEKLKERQKDLNAELKAGTIGQTEYEKEMRNVAANLVDCKNKTQAYNLELKNQVKQERENEGSLKGLRAQLNNLLKSYDELSKQDRESGIGKEKLNQIKELTTEIKTAEFESGRFQRNVGNYPGVMGQVSSAMSAMSGGTNSVSLALKGLGAQMKALLANPIILTITAVVAILAKLREAIKNNDEASTAFNELLATLKPILSVINALFAKLADILTGVFKKLADFNQKIVSFIPGLRDWAKHNRDLVVSQDQLEQKIRESSGRIAKMQEQAAELREKMMDSENMSYSQRKKAADEYMQKMYEINRQEIALLKAQYQQKYTLAMGEIGFNMKKGESWDEYFARTKDNYAKLKDETKNQLQAYADASAASNKAVYDAQKAANKAVKSANSQMRKASNQQKKENEDYINGMKKQIEDAQKQLNQYTEDAIKDSAEAEKEKIRTETENTITLMQAIIGDPKSTEEMKSSALKIIDDISRESASKIEEINKATEEKNLKSSVEQANKVKRIKLENDLAMAVKGSQDELQIKLDQLEMQRQAEVSAAEGNMELQEQINAKYMRLSDEQLRKYNDQVNAEVRKKKEGEKQKTSLALQGTKATLGAFGDLFNTLSENDKKYQKYANAISYANIMVDMAEGIAAAVAKGMEMGWPAAAVMIPLGIATVVGGIANALSIFNQNKNAGSSPKFAVGGLVQGAGTGTSDSINAKLSNGEFVVNAKSTREHLDELVAINGGWGNTSRIPRFANGGYVDVRTRQMAIDSANNAELKYIIENLPAPVVSVKEITNTQKKVQVKEQLARR